MLRSIQRTTLANKLLRATFPLVALAVALPAAAQNSVANFNTLTAPGNSSLVVANCYVEANLRFTAVGNACGTADSFATWGSADAGFYSGSPALFLNSATGTAVDITAANNQQFSFNSISLTTYLGLFGDPTTVLFFGNIFGGGTVSRSVSVSGATTTPTNFTFNDFNRLTSLRLTVTSSSFEPYVQFDDVTATVVPEPSTMMLMAVGLLFVGTMVSRRRAA